MTRAFSMLPSGSTATRATVREKLFAVAVLLYSSGAFFPLLQGERDPEKGAATGTAITNGFWILVYASACYFLVRYGKSALEVTRRNWLLIALLALPALSLFWSVDPSLTLLHLVALCGTTVVSIYLAHTFKLHQLLRLCLWALGIAGVCSAFLAVFLPRYGVGTDEFQGVWLGVYGHKNSFGSAMTVGFLVALLLFRFVRPIRFWYLFVAGFMLVLVYLSDSTTSLVICLASPLILWGSQLVVLRSSGVVWRRAAVAMATAILVMTVARNFEAVTNAVGRDEGLTGRTMIWGLVTQAILDRPVLGYGYEAFWRAYEGPSGEVWARVGQPISNSHDGFLEVWLGMGLFGIMAISIALVVVALRTARRMREQFNLETVWPWMFVYYMFVSNLTEATFLRANILPTILFLTVVHQVARDNQ